ncbi:hypothetical protein Sm713_23520 [Streptomyces sp. TS71-3]|nr:hypothetical protein Sm713_23520 [Streptomyces sp. TS71-3]
MISAEGDGRAEDLQALQDWLLTDSALGGGRATVEAPRATGGRMGIGSDEIQVILGAAAFGLELAHSIRSWLRARHGTPRVVIVVSGPEQAARMAQALGGAVDVRTEPGPAGGDTGREEA